MSKIVYKDARDKSVCNKADYVIAHQANNTVEDTLSYLQADLNGLTNYEANTRLEHYGINLVSHEKAPPALLQLLQAFNNPFIFVLMILAAISFITDYWLPLRSGEETEISSVAIILIMVSISGLLRFWQEYRSNKAAEALKSMVHTNATVLRRSNNKTQPQKQEIDIRYLVPGDIIHLGAGDMVPADVKLINSRDLFVSQAILTGESIPVEKYDVLGDISEKTTNNNNHETQPVAENDLLEMSNICLMGTSVNSGTAIAMVVATGKNTYFGSLAKSIVGTRSQTSFDRGVNSVSWLLIRFMLVMVPIVLLINGFMKGDWMEAMLFALAVAVGLTPEMLPMIVSSNLAKGAMAMAKRKVVVKRLNAIQNFGAMDVLCTDKTGTLTQDKIILERFLNINGEEDNQVYQYAWLNSFHQTGLKNVMDQAVLEHVVHKDIDLTKAKVFRKVDEIPFDFIRRRLSILVENGQQHLLVCKGASEEMLMVATHAVDKGQIKQLDEQLKQQILAKVDEYSREGFKVLVVATRQISDNDFSLPLSIQAEKNLVIQGLLTFLDPPKDSAMPAIAALNENGVTVKVLTGDNPVITSKICDEVGLTVGIPLLGPEIEEMSDEQLQQEVEQRTVFAKLTPLQKSRVLKMLQANGHTVGFLGDGINDAPALRDADVGISVDTGTDIAKESADIILLEKSLMVLEQGVIKGRETFGNIIKYLNMTASSNFGNVFSVLVASAFIPFLPMMAIHLLIQNLLYDISQLSLPWDKMDPEFLKKPRKWDAKNIGRFMIWIGPTSSIFDMTTYALMWYVFSATVGHESLFHSGWFIEGLLSQTLVVHMLRTRKIPFIQSTAALPVILLTSIIMAVGIYLPFSSLGAIVGLMPLPLSYFPWLVLTLVSYCIVAQLMKMFYIKRFGTWF